MVILPKCRWRSLMIPRFHEKSYAGDFQRVSPVRIPFSGSLRYIGHPGKSRAETSIAAASFSRVVEYTWFLIHTGRRIIPVDGYIFLYLSEISTMKNDHFKTVRIVIRSSDPDYTSLAPKVPV